MSPLTQERAVDIVAAYLIRGARPLDVETRATPPGYFTRKRAEELLDAIGWHPPAP